MTPWEIEQWVRRYVDEVQVVATTAAILASAPTARGVHRYSLEHNREYLWDGTGWIVMHEPQQTFTPGTTNIVHGTGPTRIGNYQRSAGYCDFSILFALGTGGSLTGQPILHLPFNMNYIMRGQIKATYLDSGTNTWEGACEAAQNTPNLTPYLDLVNGSYGQFANINGTTPFTWTTNDRIEIAGRFKMQTPYL